jgi:hypothetical protein
MHYESQLRYVSTKYLEISTIICIQYIYIYIYIIYVKLIYEGNNDVTKSNLNLACWNYAFAMTCITRVQQTTLQLILGHFVMCLTMKIL